MAETLAKTPIISKDLLGFERVSSGCDDLNRTMANDQLDW